MNYGTHTTRSTTPQQMTGLRNSHTSNARASNNITIIDDDHNSNDALQLSQHRQLHEQQQQQQQQQQQLQQQQQQQLEQLTSSISHDVYYDNNDTTRTSAESNAIITRVSVASVAGNVLEWFDFAIFGYLSDILGQVFFPPDGLKQQTLESFFVFGLAFLVRPIGGILFGYIGDYYGRKTSLVISIFVMAIPTFIMSLLPGYNVVGKWAIFFLILVRLLQGLSVGGQLVSSLVYLLEKRHTKDWGFYGSFIMASAIFGSLLGGITSFVLRATLTNDQLVQFGWRLPFLCGSIFVTYFGCYLRTHGKDHTGYHIPSTTTESTVIIQSHDSAQVHEQPFVGSVERNNNNNEVVGATTAPTKSSMIVEDVLHNPLREAFRKQNWRSLLSASLVPMLWASTFYLTFIWMPIFMAELSNHPIKGAFLINAISLFLSVCLLFPVAGLLSDKYGRVRIMTIGGSMLLILTPFLVMLVGRGNPMLALLSQCIMGIALSLFSAPMCAWLVEAFDPRVRLTSVAIGYNIAQAFSGGITPFLATLLSNSLGPRWPGWIITVFAIVSLIGLLFVAPKSVASTTLIIHRETLSTDMARDNDLHDKPVTTNDNRLV